MSTTDNGYSSFGEQDSVGSQAENKAKERDSSPPVGTAFGQDSNYYAYPSAGLSTWGMCSILCGLIGIVGVIPAVIGVVLGVVGLTKSRRSVVCIIGLVLSLAMTVYQIYLIISFFGDSAAMAQLQQLNRLG